jgi:hypothetical protein
MKRGRYVRVTAFLVPFPSPFSFSTDLETVAIFSSTLWVMEGWVRNDLCVGSRFYLIARIREGQRCLGIREWADSTDRTTVRLDSSGAISVRARAALAWRNLWRICVGR